MQELVSVDYRHVYDLCFRIQHARLENTAYTVDFLDWVKAGIAFNHQGVTEPSRKVARFVKIYEIIQEDSIGVYRHDLLDALTMYYEDLFKMYQNHLVAQSKASQARYPGKPPIVSDLLLLPSFEKVPALTQVFDAVDVDLMTYACKHPEDFLDSLSVIYVEEGTALYQLMSLYYDMGVRREGDCLIRRIVL